MWKMAVQWCLTENAASFRGGGDDRPAAGQDAPMTSAGGVARQREASARQVEAAASGDRAPIDPRGYDPVWSVVAGRVEKRIAAGEFEPSGRLPTVEQLAGHYGVGEGSVKRAMHSLRDRGLVKIMPAKGIFIP